MDYKAIWDHVEDLPWCLEVTVGRTGSDFFQSLLDLHSEIFVFNGKVFFHEFWDRAKSVSCTEDWVLSDIVDEFIGEIIELLKSRYEPFERKHQLGINQDEFLSVDTVEFKAHIIALLENQTVTRKSVLIAAYVAYALCLKQDVMKKKLFFHHIHHIPKVPRFMEDFPDSKIICMTRDPRALYVSGVENWRNYLPVTDNPSYPLYIIARGVDGNRPLCKFNDGRLRVLKLEDLSLEKTQHAVCQWLGVSYDDCMKQSTWGGLRWWGDALSQNKVPKNELGFSKTMSANKWEQRLCALDKAVLNYLLVDLLEWYGYPHVRRNGIIMAAIMVLAICIPTGYERRYISFKYLGSVIRERNARKFIVTFYHPLRRMIQFYKWFYRRNFGGFFMVPYIGQDKS